MTFQIQRGTFSSSSCLRKQIDRMEKMMDVNKLAGWCLILLSVINVLHEIVVRVRDQAKPGAAYAVVTAAFFTLGAVLLIRKPIPQGRKAK